MGKKSKARFIAEKRKELVNQYNSMLNEHGKGHVKTRWAQQKLEEFDKEQNKKGMK